MKRLLLAAACLLLAACTGVPASSRPEAIEALDNGGPSVQRSAPNLGADPATIVQSFLTWNATNAPTHTIARQYLTPAANSRWSEEKATIIGNDYTSGVYDSRSRTVTLYGRVLGTMDQRGIYTPTLGGDRQPFVFHLVQVGADWRIDRLPSGLPGLLLTDEQFRDTYRQQVLYYYDVPENALVPDLRWSALDDRTQLSTWLLTQLVSGPRPELQNAVTTDTMPANLDAAQIKVTLGTPTRIEIPGSSQLSAGVRDRLAAQLSQTLVEPLAGREMMITDHANPVQIPQVHAAVFSAADFASAIGPPAPAPAVYYLVNGRVHDDNGKPLAGPAGNGTTPLSSFAIGQPRPGEPLLIAGVSGSGTTARLLVGEASGALHPTSVSGALTRPAFVPGSNEVWIGDGTKLYRVTIDSSGPHVAAVPVISGGGRILALRLSPEGSRVAVVIAAGGGAGQLFIGSVVRGAGPTHVDALKPISPVGVALTDVAWLDPFKLFAIGRISGTQEHRIFETGADGTDWTAALTGNLPAPPDSVAAAAFSNVWVSANGFVWKQSGSAWVSPGPGGQTPGRAPVYLE